ncbi:Mitochondrial import inner membrane translocase subunit Tim9 [Perkinsus olseni]|uniref:Mitochondrial import inner membrane translocase subunit Tim9 n=1 Tax=Perkinsus olseni TaxID=32597 RepID=A0A7J6NSY2_PEROL|nr:Mitochondrial import inner membrane translocase subunit Tim9 [Perkinsus olseni]
MASLPNLGNLTPADQAMVNKEMQDMQVNESLQTYNGLVERCFNQCIQNFRAKNLDYEETDCVKRCVGKFMTYSQRVGTRFAEKNQQVAQDQQAAAAAATASAGHPVAARIASQDYHRLPHGAREFLRKYSDDSVPVDRRPVAELNLKRPKRETKKGLNDVIDTALKHHHQQQQQEQQQEQHYDLDNLIPNHHHLMLDDSKPKHEMAKRQFWLRARGDVGNTDAAHKSVLAYMSDFNLIATSLEPLGGIFCSNTTKLTSLDHTLYFHKTNIRADEWMLFDMRCLVSSHARAVCNNNISIIIMMKMDHIRLRLGNPPRRFINIPSLAQQEEDSMKGPQGSEDKQHVAVLVNYRLRSTVMIGASSSPVVPGYRYYSS